MDKNIALAIFFFNQSLDYAFEIRWYVFNGHSRCDLLVFIVNLISEIVYPWYLLVNAVFSADLINRTNLAP